MIIDEEMSGDSKGSEEDERDEDGRIIKHKSKRRSKNDD
eukprot:CAMPEP_0176348582 /NCGR_PEP_ID=MMETSP0126-20121128/7987_1 /TAXON_ID=141414 ORGANISM="Strombidinopsis acuminatum, Strain SPMC142" /NCGR_SAMPLE_ID=MMETSP0126 /ASSEMBLY_ACC=CAM_ASM_000229 /LENGTH=38 /DNA_ID= /DNA_START= /DNA_END= /DNA_ORIENTATION=